VHIVFPSGATQTFHTCGKVPRVSEKIEYIGFVNGIPIVRRVLGNVQDLPEKKEDTYLIVSQLVADACLGRDDLLVPADLVRDEQGRVIGCRALARNR